MPPGQARREGGREGGKEGGKQRENLGCFSRPSSFTILLNFPHHVPSLPPSLSRAPPEDRLKSSQKFKEVNNALTFLMETVVLARRRDEEEDW